MEEDGRHEDHRGVEIEHGGHRGLDQEQCREQGEGAARRPGGERSGPGEDAFPCGGRADEQQSGDECEGRPGLGKGRVRA